MCKMYNNWVEWLFALSLFLLRLSEGLLLPPAVTKCEEACLTDFRVKLICGSDQWIYANEDHLKCHNSCENTEVTVKNEGVCERLLPIFNSSPSHTIHRLYKNEYFLMPPAHASVLFRNKKPLLSNDTSFTPKSRSTPARYYSDHVFPRLPSSIEDVVVKCLQSCPKSEKRIHVCSTDNRSYQNEDEIKCKNHCFNMNLQIKHNGKCSNDREMFWIPAWPVNESLVSSESLMKCFEGCILPNTRWPVCGSDGYTYFNIKHVKCINKCQKTDVQIKHFGTCGRKPTMQEIDECPCLLVNDDNSPPFCGSNGLTYGDYSSLLCHNYCSKEFVKFQHHGPCRNEHRSGFAVF